MASKHSQLVEAAHFALLRRLSPSLRHRLMGDLQPVTLLAELAERQVSKGIAELDKTRDTIAKARQQARTAVSSMMNVLAWITHEENPKVMLKEGIDLCVDLLRTDSEIRGVRIIRGECASPETIVNRRALRTVTAAAIIAAVDMRPAPSELKVSCAKEGDCVVVRIESRHSDEAEQEEGIGDARPLTWDDVDVIAEDERVPLERKLDPLLVQYRIALGE